MPCFGVHQNIFDCGCRLTALPRATSTVSASCYNRSSFELALMNDPTPLPLTLPVCKRLLFLSPLQQSCFTDIVARVSNVAIPPFRPRVPSDLCPTELYSILLHCWSENPADRPESEKVQSALKLVPGNRHGNLIDDLMNRMEKYANDLEQRVNERTAEFMDEKKRAEDLLYQMLPKVVADKLKQGQLVEPEIFSMITVSFVNVHEFSNLCQNSGAMQVVDTLNGLYGLFDSVMEKRDVHKLDVNLDACMVVSGVTLSSKVSGQHAAEICRMAVSLISAISDFRPKHKPDEEVRLRIGIHSGPAMAAVVGLRMPKFCIFGDCVGIAAKLEATCEAKRIHISLISKRALDGSAKEFLMDIHGQVDLKGGSNMMTYWLRSAADKEC
ncbi:hypothetical protein RvY_06317-2 [Ramazzottius varieornatus]|uniref:guanylate cyclase n=1 Tax=Ramazzottius varieornatus TaxID=947166 RepID=A0A1D1V153_RAMVA|nr:hypothetical protein RvY_06317-2 [Ramazzottius varieornatus]